MHDHPTMADGLLAVALLIPVATTAIVATATERGSGNRTIGLLVGLCCTLPIAWRRRDPVTVFAVTGVAVFVGIATGNVVGPSPLGPMIALYTVAAWCDRRRSLSAVGVSFVGIVIAVVVAPRFAQFNIKLLLAPAAFVTVTWLIGDNVRVRRAYVAQLEARAEQLEREQATEAQRARDGERTRIARELHDVVAHHVSVIAVQAGAARMVAEQEGRDHASSPSPSMSDDMLASIESTARQALAELRRLLGVLRKGDDDLDRAPQPGLHQLNALVEQMRDAGTAVDLEIDDSVPVALPPGVDLSAYRIIQEALTNVLKHANGAATRVVVRVDQGDLELTVHDTGPGPVWPRAADRTSPGSGGHGLVGMGERVALFGGQLSHGPSRSGGYDVVARIPLGTDPDGEPVGGSNREDPDAVGRDRAHHVRGPTTRFDL